MNRRDSARIAAAKAREAAETHGWVEARTVGSAVASDAFFPFADGLLAAVEDIDREAVGTIAARQYTSQQPRFTLFAFAAFALWTGAAGMTVGTPWFGRIP